MDTTELLDSLNWRYATKQFDATRAIPEETWQALEQSLVLTPSSFGLQPWRFVVVTDPELRESLLPHSWNQRQVVDCSHFLVLASAKNFGTTEIERFLDEIAAARGVSKESLAGYQEMMTGFFTAMDEAQTMEWARRQVYLALGQVLLAAAVLGVDACPMEGFAPPEYDRLLGLPEQGFHATVACAFGYRSEEDKYASLPKVRFPAGQVTDHRP